MLESIFDLTNARPHVCSSEKWTPDQWRAYREGYYTGVIYALRVATEAVERWLLARRTRRAEARARKIA